MSVTNAEIARAFERLALLVDLDGGDPFKSRAYRQAAFVIEGLDEQASDMLAEGRDLTGLPGIGKATGAKIRELVETGTMSKLMEYEARIPDSMVELTELPGLGPGRVHRLREELGITDRKGLRQAAESGKIRAIKGFGEKIEARILEGLKNVDSAGFSPEVD